MKKKNNTRIGPVKWNCFVHTNKIVPKKKRKRGKKKKKKGYENSSKIFLHPKEKDISAAYFLQHSDLQQQTI
jgi:hypothetical protein